MKLKKSVGDTPVQSSNCGIAQFCSTKPPRHQTKGTYGASEVKSEN